MDTQKMKSVVLAPINKTFERRVQQLAKEGSLLSRTRNWRVECSHPLCRSNLRRTKQQD